MAQASSPDQARALFPGLSRVTYLDVAGRAPLSTPVRQAIDAFLDHAQVGGSRRLCPTGQCIAR